MNDGPEIRLDDSWRNFLDQEKIYADKKNYTRVPNFLLNDDLNISPYSLKLYLYIMRLCLIKEDGGSCFMSSENLSINTHISTGQISNSKKELLEKGLIRIESVPSSRGKPRDIITLVDIWKMNQWVKDERDRLKTTEVITSVAEVITSVAEVITSADEMIKIDLNKIELNNISPTAVSSIPGQSIPEQPTIPESPITQESPAPEIPAFLNVPEIHVIPPPPDDPIVKNPRALAALRRHEQRVASGEDDLSWLPESLWHLARAFISASDVRPTRGLRSLWISTLQDLYSDGYNQEDIRLGVVRARKDGLSIKSPKSIIYALIDPVKPAEGGDKIKQSGYISAGQMQDERRALFGRK